MKTSIKKTIATLLFIGLFFFSNLQIEAAESIASKCDFQAIPGVNPNNATLNCLLTETALANDVPPEIVKAVAEAESGDWKQFDNEGNPIVTNDNGIGIMQVTNQSKYDEELLKNDILYNIKAGVEILDSMYKRNDLPVINGGERNVIEHWYFAVMAYNGIKPVNSPIVQATGEQNSDAYQEKVFNKIKDYGLVKPVTLPFTSADFEYDSTKDANIKFITTAYDFDLSLTKTKHNFQSGLMVKANTSTSLRSQPTTGSTAIAKISTGEKLTITGPFEYEMVADRKNHFVWYPVKRSNGETGYLVSSYLNFTFKDIPDGHYAEDEINYLYDRNYLLGIGGGKFGITQNLTRWQAVLLLNRINDVSVDNRPDPGFNDVPVSYKYYHDIAAAVDEGLFKGMSATEFDPDGTLTRSQMAVVLDRLYQFPATSANHPFTDVKPGQWYTDAVNRLYYSGITTGITPTEFGPNKTVTREQFAVFLYRSMVE